MGDMGMVYYQLPDQEYSMECRIYPNKTQREIIDDNILGVGIACNITAYEIQTNYTFTNEYHVPNTDKVLHYLDTKSKNGLKKAKTKEWLDYIRSQTKHVKNLPASAMSGNSTSCFNDLEKKYYYFDKHGKQKSLSVENVKYKYYSKSNPRKSYTYQEKLSKVRLYNKQTEEELKKEGKEYRRINDDGVDNNRHAFYFLFMNVGLIKVRGWHRKIRFDENGEQDFLDYALTHPAVNIKTCIKKDNCGDYWAVFTFVSEETHVYKLGKQKDGTKIGYDVGQTDLVVTSKGKKYPNPKFAEGNAKKSRVYHRQLSRAYGWSNPKFRKEYKEDKTIEPSHNYDRLKLRNAKHSRKIARRRENRLHNVSHEIVQDTSIVCVETLSVKDMMNRERLHEKRGTRKKAAKTASRLSDAAMSKFLKMVEYKTEWFSRELRTMDKYDRSTGVCWKCGYVTPPLDTSIREWDCPCCGTHHYRDESSAIVIEYYAKPIEKKKCNKKSKSKAKQSEKKAA